MRQMYKFNTEVCSWHIYVHLGKQLFKCDALLQWSEPNIFLFNFLCCTGKESL